MAAGTENSRSLARSVERASQHELFLMDGLLSAPSPVLLVVTERAIAARFALALHAGSAPWNDRPARVGSLRELDLARIDAAAGEFTRLLAELAGTDDWIYLPDIDSLVETMAGQRLLDELMASVGRGEPAAVITSTTPERLPKVQAEAPRLMGFACALQVAGDSDRAGPTYAPSIVLRSTDPTDVGWVVAVRYGLTKPIRTDAGTTDNFGDGRFELIDSIKMIGRDGEPPLGLLVSLKADAFTVSQENAAFASATLAAERLVGRQLGREEHLVAARGIFYS